MIRSVKSLISERKGYANDFKPKRIKSKIVMLKLQIPKERSDYGSILRVQREGFAAKKHCFWEWLRFT